MSVRYLTLDELVYINENLPNIQQVHLALYGKRRVRDMSLLEAAVGRPQQSVFGEDAYPTLTEKTTAMLHSIVRNHPFADGNKRTGTVALLFMAAVNGSSVQWEDIDALERIIGLAEGSEDIHSFADWLRMTKNGTFYEQDAAHDTALINDIMAEHRWLLDALAER
jgi:death on curing protein